MDGWFWVNVIAPLVLPQLGVMTLWLLPNTRAVSLLATVKDGQLCWVAMVMGLATLYELIEPVLTGVKRMNPNGGVIIIVVITLLLPSMLLAAGGAAHPTKITKSKLGFINWFAHFKTMVASIVISLIMATVYSITHYRGGL